jgi:large subunit ribosomal protein L18
MKKTKTPRAARVRRHARVRRRLHGTAEKPRLAVFRSLSHIYAQVIDDVSRTTVAAASDMEPALKGRLNGKKKAEVATIIGEVVAERAKSKGLKQVVFDRGGFPFHGRIKALAEAARAGGLEF